MNRLNELLDPVNSTDPVWGHVGLQLDEGPSRWFPVAEAAEARVRAGLADGVEWIAFPTLANRHVAFRPTAVRRLWLLDEPSDEPGDDWNNEFPYAGLPLEFYRAFEAALDEGRGDEAAWNALAERMRAAIGEEASTPFVGAIRSKFTQYSEDAECAFIRHMHHTSFHFVDGRADHDWIEPRSLVDFLSDIAVGDGPRTTPFEVIQGDAMRIYPARRLSAVIMPLADLLDGRDNAVAPSVWTTGADAAPSGVLQ